MRVCVYIPKYNETHQQVLRAFARGIPGAQVRYLEEFREDSQVAVVFGWYKYAFLPTMKKKPIIDHYLKAGRLIVVESAFLKRKEYYQIGWNGFAGHADFKNEGVPMDRWKALGIKAKPWNMNRNGLAVICGQLPRDTQVQDVDHLKWCRETFLWYCNRMSSRAVFRPHPRHENPGEYGIDPSLHDTRALKKVLEEASLIVTWNSTTAVEAVVAGVPVVACNRGSMAWPMAEHQMTLCPSRPKREAWLAGLGYAQWTLEEMERGLPWRHLTRSTNYAEAIHG